ncbi:MAG: hypothetical protein U9N81_01185 [Bacillota bacterium]|nr:hypothetical protein [Bacillota bacterium]
MRKVSRRIISGILSILLMVSIVPTSVLGAPNTGEISLEQAIQEVKEHFTIPEEYTEFTSSFWERNNQQGWSLRWSAEERRDGSFNADVDTQTGIITSINSWKEERSGADIPAISREQATEIGMKLLTEIIPDRVCDLKIRPNEEVIPLHRWGGGRYTIHWQRVAGDIPVENDGVTMGIDYMTGEIVSYNQSWSDEKLPSAEGTISEKQACDAFINNEMLRLEYLLPNRRIKSEDGEKELPKLVYRLHHQSNGLIDAFTGEPLINENEMRYSNDKEAMMGGMGESQNAISPQELKEIEQTLNLISQEQAVAVVKKWVSIPEEMKLSGSSLNPDYQYPEQRMWSLNWDTNSKSNSYGSFYARVNAVTGEILSFSLYSPEKDNKGVKLQRKDAEKIALNFLGRIQPDKKDQVELETMGIEKIYDVLKDEEIPSQWRFYFTRLVNGIPCHGNGISINVDSSSKKIVSYNLNWTDVAFPSADKVLGQEKANEIYLTEQPMTLHFTPWYGDKEIRARDAAELKLVYSPQAVPPQRQVQMIDAISGDKLGWDGKPVAEQQHPCVFGDIAGHFAEKEISLLGQAGILCEYKTAFHPQEEIKLVTLLRAMLGVENDYYRSERSSDDEVMKEAVRRHWIEEGQKPETIVTRDLLAQMMIRWLDIDFITRMSGEALQAPYQDYAGLAADMKGYAALTWGLGIIRGDGVHFNAAHPIARGEAAVVLIRTLKIEGEKHNY